VGPQRRRVAKSRRRRSSDQACRGICLHGDSLPASDFFRGRNRAIFARVHDGEANGGG